VEDRNASLAKMQKRLGEYQPAPQRQQVAQREPEPIKPGVPGWKDYITGRKAHYAEKNAAKLAQDKRQEQERKALQEHPWAAMVEVYGEPENGDQAQQPKARVKSSHLVPHRHRQGDFFISERPRP
jgi:hypothetical protein